MFGFEFVPRKAIESSQDNGESVVGKFDLAAYRLAEQGLDGFMMCIRPVLDGHLAVVGLRQNEGDPDHDEVAVG